MQTHGGAAAEEAILASERVFVTRLRVDWLRNDFQGHPLNELDPYVSEITTDRNLAGTAPSEVMLIEGSAAAEMSFTLGGVWRNQGAHRDVPFVAVFSPYNGYSPLYNLDPVGCPVEYDIGVETALGTVWYPQFRGRIRTITPRRADNEVVLTALDGAEDLRQPVSLPIWAVASMQASRGYEVAQMCESQWVIDQALRSADISAGPFRATTPRELQEETGLTVAGEVQLWVTGNGSYIPNIGKLDNSRVQGFPHNENPSGSHPMYNATGVAHPDSPNPEIRPMVLGALGGDGSGIVPQQIAAGTYPDQRLQSSFLQYRAQDSPERRGSSASSVIAGGTHFLGFRLITHGHQGNWWQTGDVTVLSCRIGRSTDEIRLRILNGNARLEYFVNASTPTTHLKTLPIPTGQESVLIEAQVHGQVGSGRIGLRVGNTFSTYTAANKVGGDNNTNVNQRGLITVNHRVGIQDIYWSCWNYPLLDSFNETEFRRFARRQPERPAVLDHGLNRLSHMPQSTYEDAWALITSVASAEYGSVFFDERGVFRFWNRNTMLDKQSTLVRRLTLDNAEDLTITNSYDSIRNIVTADSTVAYAVEGVIYDESDADATYIPPTTRKTWIVDAGEVQTAFPWDLTRYRGVSGGGSFPDWSDDVTHGYVMSFQESNGVWHENASAPYPIEVRASVDVFGRLVLTSYNGYGVPVRFTKNNGDPALRIAGTSVIRSDTQIIQTRDDQSIDVYGPRNLPLSGDWVQRQPSSVPSLIDGIVNRTRKPIPTTDGVVTAGDPRLQLGDTVTVQDPDGLGEEIRLQILGIRRSWSRDSGLTDTLTVEMIQPAGAGIWDSPQYGQWDVSFKWS